jgi:hypothetical protein
MRPSTRAAVAALVLLAAGPARAAVSEPDAHEDDAFDLMNVLTAKGWHDLANERWNVYGQVTYISSWQRGFSAAYTNLNLTPNSLSPNAQYSFTGTATVYLGVALWPGAEAYLVPEVISERPLSGLKGLGGAIQNFELQKSGSETPLLYRSRAYLRQTIELGGDDVKKSSEPMQLGTTVKSRRLTFTLGNFSILDFFDKNAFSGDLRRQFFNMAFLSYAAYDFAADARGYTWGGIAELRWDDWAVRVGRIAPPKDPNQLEIDFRIDRHYGDQVELEHEHTLLGEPGAVRVLGYRNQEKMGRFDDAMAAFTADPTRNATTCNGFSYDSHNATAPDLCWARKSNIKMGIGINLEQRLHPDIGVFFRGMYSDGQTEVYSYTSADRSVSFGALGKGRTWWRPRDVVGVGLGTAWISASHARYLNAGGIDGFIGDGKLNQAAERVFEVFYSANLVSPIWISADFQRISNPAYNADRGGVTIWGARLHGEILGLCPATRKTGTGNRRQAMRVRGC